MKKYIQMVVVLFVISTLSGLIMGGVHLLTKDIIAENELKKSMKKMLEIFPEMENYTDITADVELTSGIERVYEVFGDKDKKEKIGYIVEMTTTGYQSGLKLIIGVKTDGTIRGLRSPSNNETPGFGKTKLENADYLAQFENLADPSTIDPKGGINAGATITTNAVLSALRNARNFVLGLQGLTDPIQEAAAAIFGYESYHDVTDQYSDFVNENRLGLYAVKNTNGNVLGYLFRLYAPKPYREPLETFIGIDLDGKIVGIAYGEFNETDGWGKKVQDPAFINEFIGRSSIDQIDMDKLDEILGITYENEDKTAGSTLSGPGKTKLAMVNAVAMVFDYFNEHLSDQKDLILGLFDGAERYEVRYLRGHQYILNIYEVYGEDENLLGYVYKTNAVKSFASPLEIFFALDQEGAVVDVAYGAFNETDGWGAKAKEERFINALKGAKSIDDIDTQTIEDEILAGATKTREGILETLDLVFKHFAEELFDYEEAIQTLFPAQASFARNKEFFSDEILKEVYEVFGENEAHLGYAFRVEAPNAFKGIEMFVGLDHEGKVIGLYFTVVEETPSSDGNWGGKLLETQEFIDLFINKSDPSDIDNIDYSTGATKTRDAVIEGVKYVLHFYKERLSK